MKRQKINICRNNGGDNLTVITTATVKVDFDLDTMELTATYKGKKYPVQGTIYFQYIIVE